MKRRWWADNLTERLHKETWWRRRREITWCTLMAAAHGAAVAHKSQGPLSPGDHHRHPVQGGTSYDMEQLQGLCCTTAAEGSVDFGLSFSRCKSGHFNGALLIKCARPHDLQREPRAPALPRGTNVCLRAASLEGEWFALNHNMTSVIEGFQSLWDKHTPQCSCWEPNILLVDNSTEREVRRRREAPASSITGRRGNYRTIPWEALIVSPAHNHAIHFTILSTCNEVTRSDI